MADQAETINISVDYLVVGAGAMSLAFVDAMLTSDPDASFAILDRRLQPGGHWNDAYDFVTLHQPAVSYGVNSVELASDDADLASKPQILSYYQNVIERFIKTGRVQFFGGVDYVGGLTAVYLRDRTQLLKFDVVRKEVDGTYLTTQVPSSHAPQFDVSSDAMVISPNGLTQLDLMTREFVVIGGGKTSIDTVAFLLKANVSPDKIHWIIPNHMWIWNRQSVLPGNVINEVLSQALALKNTESVEDAFMKLEQNQSTFRLSSDFEPTKWRCAILDSDELEQVRRVQSIVQSGRVTSVSSEGVLFADGTKWPVSAETVFVNCTAAGLTSKVVKPIFENRKITLQSMMLCQQVFSAALIGKIEADCLKHGEKRLDRWRAVSHPDTLSDLQENVDVSFSNTFWATMAFPIWMRRSRLNLAGQGPLLGYVWQMMKAGLFIVLNRSTIFHEPD